MREAVYKIFSHECSVHIVRRSCPVFAAVFLLNLVSTLVSKQLLGTKTFSVIFFKETFWVLTLVDEITGNFLCAAVFEMGHQHDVISFPISEIHGLITLSVTLLEKLFTQQQPLGGSVFDYYVCPVTPLTVGIFITGVFFKCIIFMEPFL